MNSILLRMWRAVCFGSMSALAVLIVAWQLQPERTVARALLALVFCLPLLAPLRGIWRGDRYVLRWATLCVTPYFVIGPTEAVANPNARIWAGGILVCALAWFVALVALLRITAPDSREKRARTAR